MSKRIAPALSRTPITFVEATNASTIWIAIFFLLGGVGLLAFSVVLNIRPRAAHMTNGTVIAIAVTGMLLSAIGVMLIAMRQKLVVDRWNRRIGDVQPLVQPWGPRYRPMPAFFSVVIMPVDTGSSEYYVLIRGETDSISFARQHSLDYGHARRIAHQIAATCEYDLYDASGAEIKELPVSKWFEPLGRVLAADREHTEPNDAPPGCRVKWISSLRDPMRPMPIGTTRESMRDRFELPTVGFRWRHVWLTLLTFAGLLGFIAQLAGQEIPGKLPIVEVVSGIYVVLVCWTLIGIALIRETITIDAENLVIERRGARRAQRWSIPLDELESIELASAAWRDRTLGPLRGESVVAAHAFQESCVFGIALTAAEQKCLSDWLQVAASRRYEPELTDDEADDDGDSDVED